MTIYKCDICKKEIKDTDKEISIFYRMFRSYSLCAKCGQPVINYLKKNKLVDNASEEKASKLSKLRKK
jgi:DNA-directed RNA polymerase subunit RPC12/RpoP